MMVRAALAAAAISLAALGAGCAGLGSRGGPEPPSHSDAAPGGTVSESGSGAPSGIPAVPSPADVPAPSGGDAPFPEAAPTPTPVPPPAEAVLVAVGDVMMHKPMVPGVYDEASGTYDFTGFFAPLRDVFLNADWAFANLETPIGGDERGFPGYPRFNAPVALADALVDAGFDVVSTANNHSLDQNYSGLVHTLEVLRERGIRPAGTADSEEAAGEIVMLERNGIVNAFLAYTYGTNGIPIPKDHPYAVNLIDEDRIAADIAKARGLGADIVTVSLHFGNEYQRNPSEEQRRLAEHAVRSGADVVLGHHPHVVQPYDIVRVEDAEGNLRTGAVIYSLGNFVSNQFGNYKEYGAVFEVTFRKTYSADGSSVTEITGVRAFPTWVHKYFAEGKARYRVLPLDSPDRFADDPLLTAGIVSELTEKSEELHRHLQKYVSAVSADAQKQKAATGSP